MAWRLLRENGTERVLTDGEYRLGRGEECELLTPAGDARVSRVHARLRVDGDRLWVEDLGSANGTRINGQPVTHRREVRSGDLLQVGDSGFRLRLVTPDDPPDHRAGAWPWLRVLPLWLGRLAACLLAVSLFLTWFEAFDFDRTYLELLGNPAAWIALHDARGILLVPLLLALAGLLAWLPARTETVRTRLLTGFLLGGAAGVGTTWTVREQLAGWRLFDFGLEQTLGNGFTLFGLASALLLLAGATGLAGRFFQRGGLRAAPRTERTRRLSGG